MSTYLHSHCIYLVTSGRAALLRPRTYTSVKWAVPQDLPQYMSQIPLMRAFRAHAGMDEWRMHLAIALLHNTDPVERRLLQSWMTPVSRASDCPSSVPSCPLSRESFVLKARGARGSLKRGRYQASSVSYLAPQEGERMQHTSRPPKFPRTTHKHGKASCHMAGKSLCKEENYADPHLQKSNLCSLCNASQVGINSKYCKYAVSAALSLSTGI
jgi:hypothetical protein